MTNYRIKAFYDTGDSEESYETSTTLSPMWTDLAKAKIALQVLREHHDLHLFAESSYYTGKVTDEDMKNIESKPWYHKPSPWSDWCRSVKVLGDNDNVMISDVPYHGYFENLHSLKIVTEEPTDNDMEVHF